MNPLIQLKKTTPLLLITLTLHCFALLPKAQAVVPPPDGGYPGFNTAEGHKALLNLTTGSGNTAVGWYSLSLDATGSFNTATGAGSLLFNTGDTNTAFGAAALLGNGTGSNNTAVGAAALSSNTEGGFNTATGAFALQFNTTGERNTATGYSSLFSNTEGVYNTATGNAALGLNTTGDQNTVTGANALFFNTSGNNNTAVGFNALNSNATGSENTAIGHGALENSTGNFNTALGSGAGGAVQSANNVIAIGTAGLAVDHSCFIGNIYGNAQPIVGIDPDSVTITSTGRLGRGNVSSRRYKHDIKRMDKASEALYALKPVSFRYHKEYDATQTLAFGLIAEEVAEVYPDLVGRNPQGEAESVRYEQVNAMLLNEFLKEHHKNEEQEATIAQLKQDFQSILAHQQNQIEALTTGLQKVSDQLELSKAEPEVAVNNP